MWDRDFTPSIQPLAPFGKGKPSSLTHKVKLCGERSLKSCNLVSLSLTLSGLLTLKASFTDDNTIAGKVWESFFLSS
ncbi:hypothetical protein MANES_03G051816v8 [Manihot esculenta]|uniref:Uncharacterized protein n=1 Tax=Manihot esculenta TaxID=3983 RepID=A0ACB7I2D2_MANES|nr:hypothetical protein MANES_03G051816v8 [Manihot esculenta]